MYRQRFAFNLNLVGPKMALKFVDLRKKMTIYLTGRRNILLEKEVSAVESLRKKLNKIKAYILKNFKISKTVFNVSQ
jgi:hypothetical protein